jgi:DNA-binding NarL/FixJ family response regulator
MTAITTDFSSATDEHSAFLAIMPRVSYLARRRFAYMPQEQRDDAVAEAIAAGFQAYLSMKRRGRLKLIGTIGFARNAVRHVAAGRRVGSSQAGRDVMSDLGRRRHGLGVQSLDAQSVDSTDGCGWLHEAVADRQTPVPEQVAIRVDGGRWLASLKTRDKWMIEELAAGELAAKVARRFGISPARLSQLCKEWADSWAACVGTAA